MSSNEVSWETDLVRYWHLEQRDAGDDLAEDDGDDDDESNTSTTQTKTATSSKKTSESSNASIISVSSQSTTLANAITSASSISSQVTTIATATPIISTTSASVKSTFLTSIITTPASISGTPQGKGNPNTTSSIAASTATAVAEGLSPSRSNTPDKTTINIAVGVGAISLLLLALLMFIFRNPIKAFFEKRKTSRSDATRSIWRGESMVTTAPASEAPRQIYTPPRNMGQQSALVPPLRLNPDNQGQRMVSVNTVTRQERLGLVRDLPPSRNLDIEVRREVEQTISSRGVIGLAKGGGRSDEKGGFKAQTSTEVWDNSEMAARRESGASSEASVRRWRRPVSWVRDQRNRGWGRLGG